MYLRTLVQWLTDMANGHGLRGLILSVEYGELVFGFVRTLIMMCKVDILLNMENFPNSSPCAKCEMAAASKRMYGSLRIY